MEQETNSAVTWLWAWAELPTEVGVHPVLFLGPSKKHLQKIMKVVEKGCLPLPTWRDSA